MNSPFSDEINQIKKECWNRAFHAHGTSYVFEEKSKFYTKWLRVISVTGVITPLFIGTVAGTYGSGSIALSISLTIAGIVGLFQVVLSGYSLIDKWDDMLGYCLDAFSKNRQLATDFEELGNSPSKELSDYETKFIILKTKDDFQRNLDEKIQFSEKEKNKGYLYGLWIQQKPCKACKKVPLNMIPTSCKTCGDF